MRLLLFDIVASQKLDESGSRQGQNHLLLERELGKHHFVAFTFRINHVR